MKDNGSRMIKLAHYLAAICVLVAVSHFVIGGELPLQGLDGWSNAELAVLKTLQIHGLPAKAADPSNVYEQSAAAAALGKQIFFDPRFSANQSVSCASCHNPQQQFQDGRALGQGIATGTRRTMPIVESGHSPWQFWDGRKDSVWSQALGPLEDAKEHGGNRVAHVRLIAEHYGGAYELVFRSLPDMRNLPESGSPLGTSAERSAWQKMSEEQRQAVSHVFANMGKAIAAYESTLHQGPSTLDTYIGALAQHSPDASQLLAAPEKRGLRLFIGKGQCVTCHAGPLLTDQNFHNTGVAPRRLEAPDGGRASVIDAVLKDEFNCLGRYSDAKRHDCAELEFIAKDDPHMVGAFKTPSLRNVATRAPYMHAGQIATLADVVRHYAKAPAAVVGHSERQPIPFSDNEIHDLVAFMKTLNGPINETNQLIGR